ncbi:SMP-30/Gluconolaconase/LRE-like region [Gimesia panareensis]|uniref:SMP-30/Gluconolaconase/LRE-like region n=1 Tax=Gimesia panareensis TaxID=2527978 RepID=A0A518FS93_9PLAN|nr:hypothetical protein [Gimesia panareensis]QDV19180.1 SMP-30/Gluconolaconase/LRE-like region [Gimesia panareensis]
MHGTHSSLWMWRSAVLGCGFTLVVITSVHSADPKLQIRESKPNVAPLEQPAISSPLIEGLNKKTEAVKVPEGTHEQIAVIEVGSKLLPGMRINSFCLDREGQLLAACGDGPGEIRVFDPDGKLLETWKVPIGPEAINVDEDGTVYVAGSGKLLKLDSHGKILVTKEAPHAKAVKASNAKLREQVVQQMKSRSSAVSSMIPRLENMIKQLKDKDKKLTEQDEKRIVSYERILKQYKLMAKAEEKQKEPTDAQIDAQVAAMSKRKMRVSSLSANEKEIFIACSAIKGYGYDVWRMDKDFGNPSVVVTGLRGCCGQMDVQCCEDGIFVAENSRHRVNHYDRTGKLLKHWGKRDRNGVEGFGSCCNPMNVAVGKEGEVYTAESNLGYIKRYSTDGKYLGFVGKVKLVPGCKNVSIMVSPDGDRVYMMDLTRNHIIVMARKPTATTETSQKKS